MFGLPIDTTSLIAVIIALICAGLYFLEYSKNKKLEQSQKNYSLETKQKAAQLIQAAEKIESHILSEASFDTKQLLSDFNSKLENLMDSSNTTLTASQDELIKFMAGLQKRSSEFEETSRKSTESRINELFARLEERLSNFLIETEQKTTSSIELELKSTRQLIETYKNQQLKLIDENILAIMEQTLNIVLGKKLSLKDQLDLVYESLERAKVDKFIV